jgi:hypothetical protein
LRFASPPTAKPASRARTCGWSTPPARAQTRWWSNTDPAGTRVTISGEPSAFLHWGRAGEIKLVLPPDLARKLTVTAQQDTGVVIAQADIDQLIADTDTGAVVLSGTARRDSQRGR